MKKKYFFFILSGDVFFVVLLVEMSEFVDDLMYEIEYFYIILG